MATRNSPLELAFELLFGVVNLLIYYFISRTLRGSTAELQGAPSYFAFAAVGIALTVVTQVATVRVAYGIREDRLTGVLEALMAQPVRAGDVAVGLAGFHFLFASLRVAIYIGIAGVALGVDLSKADWLGFALVLFLTACAMGAFAVVLAALVLYVRRADVLGGLVATAMALGGGAYFPISSLPHSVRPVALVLPTRFAFDGLRSALYRGTGWAAPLGWLVLYTAIGLPLAILLFGRALEFARARGSLTRS